MAEGYTVNEAAEVLGVPQSRVWELIARGVLAGSREGDEGMRVFLQPQAESVGVQRAEAGTGTDAAAFASSPFRELLSEFRNLTERYGQALLALGESRGEVASLRNRVELLEVRMDLRLPSSVSSVSSAPSEPIAAAWLPAAAVETDADTGESAAPAAAESDVDIEQAVAATNLELGERTRRRARVTRPGKAHIAEALARADDPTTALPGAEPESEPEPEPAAVAAVFDDSFTLDQPIATDLIEASVQVEVEEAPVPEVVEPPYQGRYATTFDEPDWISEAELDGSYWRTQSEAEPEPEPPVAQPEPEAWIEEPRAPEEAAPQPDSSMQEQVASEAAGEPESDAPAESPSEEWRAVEVAETEPTRSDIEVPAFTGEAASADEEPGEEAPQAEPEGEAAPEPSVEEDAPRTYESSSAAAELQTTAADDGEIESEVLEEPPSRGWPAADVAELEPAWPDFEAPVLDGEAASADEALGEDAPPVEAEVGEAPEPSVEEPVTDEAAAEEDALPADESAPTEAEPQATAADDGESEDEMAAEREPWVAAEASADEEETEDVEADTAHASEALFEANAAGEAGAVEPEAEPSWPKDPRLSVLGAWDEDLAHATDSSPATRIADSPEQPPAIASREHPEEEELMWLGLDYPASDYAAELELPTAGWRPAAPADTPPADLATPASVSPPAEPTARQPLDQGGMDAIRALLAARGPAGEAGDDSARDDAADASDASVKAMVASWVPHDALEPDATDATAEAPRSYPGAFARRRLTLPGSRELDDSLAALGVTSEASDATEAPDAPAALAVEWAKRRLGEAAADKPDEAARRAPFTDRPAFSAEVQPIQDPDPEWLRGRRDPAARAFRRLRRLFPS